MSQPLDGNMLQRRYPCRAAPSTPPTRVRLVPPTAAAPKATEPQESSDTWGVFGWSEGGAVEQTVDKQYLANGSKPEPAETLAWALETKAQMVDVKFCDLLGSWQHMTLPISAFGADAFDEGLGFDGS